MQALWASLCQLSPWPCPSALQIQRREGAAGELGEGLEQCLWGPQAQLQQGEGCWQLGFKAPCC